MVNDDEGQPVAGAQVVLAGLNLTATTDEDGTFQITDVPISFGIDSITVQLTDETGSFFGTTTGTQLVPNGITDAGLITLTNLCDEIGIDLCMDSDNDCLPDWLEEILGLDPNNPDTDGNGIPDGEEDPDLDGLTNCAEAFLGTDQETADSDNDGLTDGEEVFDLVTSPLNPDTDFDGIRDGDEMFPPPGFPLTDPLSPDTDLDGIDDGLELAEGTDPLDPTSRPAIEVNSAKVCFLNALEGESPDSVVYSVSSAIASYLNAIDAQQNATSESILVLSPVTSYNNDITPPADPGELTPVFSNVVHYLNATPPVVDPQSPEALTPFAVSSEIISYLNAPLPTDNPDILSIISKLVTYFNQP